LMYLSTSPNDFSPQGRTPSMYLATSPNDDMSPFLPTSLMTKRRSKVNWAMDKSHSPPGAAALPPTQSTGSSTTGWSCEQYRPSLPQPQRILITRHGPRHGDDTPQVKGSTEENRALLGAVVSLDGTDEGPSLGNPTEVGPPLGGPTKENHPLLGAVSLAPTRLALPTRPFKGSINTYAIGSVVSYLLQHYEQTGPGGADTYAIGNVVSYSLQHYDQTGPSGADTYAIGNIVSYSLQHY
jgi:hypothetical protein